MGCWQVCEQNEDYEVSLDGRVRSRISGLELKPQDNGIGYKTVAIRIPGHKGRMTYVHRLVARAFIGPCPAGMEVHHVDRDLANNHADNLRYVTHGENLAERYNHFPPVGAKFSFEQVREARRLRKSGLKFREIAEKFGVHLQTAYRVCHGETYSRVT